MIEFEDLADQLWILEGAILYLRVRGKVNWRVRRGGGGVSDNTLTVGSIAALNRNTELIHS